MFLELYWSLLFKSVIQYRIDNKYNAAEIHLLVINEYLKIVVAYDVQNGDISF